MRKITIGARNTWFGQHIFAILDVVKLVLLLVLLLTFINFNVKLSQQVTAIHNLTTQQKENTDTINKHLDCLVKYFSTPNRTTNTTLSKTTPCSINNPGVSVVEPPKNPSVAVTTPSSTPATIPQKAPTKPPVTQPTPTGPPPDPNEGKTSTGGGSDQSFLDTSSLVDGTLHKLRL